MLTGYTTNLPTDTLFGAGVLYYSKNGSLTALGVTDGAPDFDPGDELGDIMFDQKPSRLKGTIRRVGFTPVIKGTLKEFGPSATGNQIGNLETGGTEATAGGVTTETPAAAGALIAAGSYLADVRWIFERAAGGYAAIYFPFAHVRKWTSKGMDKKEAQIAFEMVAVGDPVNDLGTAPYAVEIRTALPTDILFLYHAGDSLASGTYSRPSSATYYDINGIVQTATTGVARDGHYIGGVRHLLIEGQRTNSLLNSGTLTGYSGFNGGGGTVVVTQNAGAAPDGTNRAAALTCNSAGTGQHGIDLGGAATTDNTVQAVSVFVKAGTKSWVYWQTNRKDTSFPRSWIHLAGSGVVGTTDPAHTITVEALGGGWYRLGVLVNSMSGAGSFAARILPADGDNNANSTDALNDVPIYVWGPDHEVDQPSVSSYIETTSSTVTRSADSLTFPFTAGPQTLTHYADFTDVGVGRVVNTRIMEFGQDFTHGFGFNVHSANSNFESWFRTAVFNLSGPGLTGAIGDHVELRAVVTDTGGSGNTQCGVARAGGAETLGGVSTSEAIGSPWATGAAMTVMGNGNGSIAIRKMAAVAGAQSLATMRAL